MAIIADDSPYKEKESTADITLAVNESPANEGFCTDKIINISQQPCTIEQDPDKVALPPPEITSEPEISCPLPVETKVKKKRQRKRKSKKIKAVVLVKGPRTKPGISSGKFHLTLPKKSIKNGLFFIALSSILGYQLAQSSIICTQSVPVPNYPLPLSHNDQRYTFQNPTFCPENVHISNSCVACFEETSLLNIICNSAVNIKIWGESRKGEVSFIKITSEETGFNYFVNNSVKLRKKRSIEWSLGTNLKGNKEIALEDKKGNLALDTYDDEICSITVPVTDFPIVIRKDVHSDSFNEATFCPESVEVLKNYSACFKNLTLLKISYRKNGNEDLEPLWVEHGKGRGTSDLVDMNSAVLPLLKINSSGRRYGWIQRSVQFQSSVCKLYSKDLASTAFFVSETDHLREIIEVAINLGNNKVK